MVLCLMNEGGVEGLILEFGNLDRFGLEIWEFWGLRRLCLIVYNTIFKSRTGCICST